MTHPLPVTRSRLSAKLVHVSLGDHALDPAPVHRLIVHHGAPVFAISASDGVQTERHLQRDGDIDFIPAGCWGRWRDEGPAHIIALSLCPSIFSAAAAALGRPARSIRLRPRLHVRDNRLAALARLAPRDDETGAKPFSEAIATAIAVQILMEASREGEPQPRVKPLDQRRLKAVLALIDERLDQSLSLDALADAVGLKRSHFAAAFRLATGQSPRQYLIHRRVETARRLLEAGRTSISEIAFQTGFSHQSHLSRAMRQHVGLSPSDLLRTGGASLVRIGASLEPAPPPRLMPA